MSGARDLLLWFDKTGRDLPWRRTRDPYGIWVSEVMLQQTRVDTAIPYYERFLKRFPGVSDLATAEIDEVLALWSGLGYYRRARQLHAAARQIVATGSEFPATVDGLLALPGIGPYTAAAVASIAFGVVEPVLDGNVERVLSRQLSLELDPRRSKGKRLLREAARAFLVPDRAGDSNQALMELGAIVCTPRTPRCDVCPLVSSCEAAAAGNPEAYPRLQKRAPAKRVRRTGVVVVENRRVLLFRRPDDSRLLAGIWEIPWVDSGTPQLVRRRLVRSYGGSWKLGESAGKVRHSITRRAFEIDVVVGAVETGEEFAEGAEAGWFTSTEVDRLASTSLVGKILARAGFQPDG